MQWIHTEIVRVSSTFFSYVCKGYLIAEKGACVRECGPGRTQADGINKCVDCDGPCPKRKCFIMAYKMCSEIVVDMFEATTGVLINMFMYLMVLVCFSIKKSFYHATEIVSVDSVHRIMLYFD